MKNILAGKYELRKKIGEGASGIVYLAWDRHLEHFVAIKEQKPISGADENEMLKREMEMLKTLRHPMLPAVYDYFQEESRYLVMEYIEGCSLHNYIEREGCIPEEQACIWALQLAGLLTCLHTEKPPVIYRDLKPENIIVCPDGNLRVIDFGAAASIRYDKYQQDSLAGTRGYAAPEALEEGGVANGSVDERSDIYTLGATLYHMLTGYNPSLPPYGVRPVRSMNPQLSAGIEEIVRKCTQPEASKRYQTAEEAAKDIRRRKYLGGRHFWNGGKRKKRQVILKIEKKIRLTEKKTAGLLGIVILAGMIAAGALPIFVKGKEAPLPVIVYNAQGQKLVIRYGSVYKTEENLLLELEKELFDKENIQELTISLTDSVTGERRERVFYIQGTNN